MNIGEKIKHLRTEKNLTQPQLAEQIGIEQSYLSKLENDKSTPSAEVFGAMLKAFGLDVPSFLNGLDRQVIERQLKTIPEVAAHLNTNINHKIHRAKTWLYSSAVAGVLGASLVVAGHWGLVFANKQFFYRSWGVVLPGEPEDIGDTYRTLLQLKEETKEISHEEMVGLYLQFKLTRPRPEELTTSQYKGESFRLALENGYRPFRLERSIDLQPPQNRYLILTGALLFFSGLFGFFTEARLRNLGRSLGV